MRQKSVILSAGSFPDLIDPGAIHGTEVRKAVGGTTAATAIYISWPYVLKNFPA